MHNSLFIYYLYYMPYIYVGIICILYFILHRYPLFVKYRPPYHIRCEDQIITADFAIFAP